MIFLDANVLVYAVGDDAERAALAADVLALSDSLPLRATARVIEEFAHVFARRSRGREAAVARANDYAEILAPVVFTGEEELAAGFELWLSNDALDLADAVLAATCLARDAALVSADRAFATVADLRYLDLADPDLRDRLMR